MLGQVMSTLGFQKEGTRVENIKYSHIFLLAVGVISIIYLVPYFASNHTYHGGIGVKHNKPLSDKAFIENLKYHGISYKIDSEGVIWYTKSNEAKVHKIHTHHNYKLVKNNELGYEREKKERRGYKVITFPYPTENAILIMWHEN